MNQTIDLLQAHRSIRKFTAQKIEADTLTTLIESGQAAATSSFIQATSVVQVTAPDVRQQFVELSGGQKYIASAAEFLVFCADLQRNKARIEAAGKGAEFGWTEQFLAATVDVALFAQNVVIAAESLGLGCCYIGGIRNDPQRVSELLSLPDLVYPVFGLCLGYPDQSPAPKPRLPRSAVCHQGAYQSAEKIKVAIDDYDQLVKKYYQVRSDGKLDMTWSQQMQKQSATQSRPFMLEFLQKKGFLIK